MALEGRDEGVGRRGGAGGGSFTHPSAQTHLRTCGRAHKHTDKKHKYNETIQYEFTESSSFPFKPNQSTHPLHNSQVPTKIHKNINLLIHLLTHARTHTRTGTGQQARSNPFKHLAANKPLINLYNHKWTHASVIVHKRASAQQ